MPRKIFRPPENAAASPYYSAATKAGGFVFVSGQGPWDPERSAFAGETIEEQADLTLRSLQGVLQEAGAGLTDVVKVQVHLRDLNDFDRFNQVYVRFFPAPAPARTTVGSDLGEIMIEIDAIAFTGP
jgi:2-iminobutanoate/2-iminopropanoate deaminase